MCRALKLRGSTGGEWMGEVASHATGGMGGAQRGVGLRHHAWGEGAGEDGMPGVGERVMVCRGMGGAKGGGGGSLAMAPER